MEITNAKRVFKIGSLELDDPAPDLSPEEAVRLYQANYPVIASGELEGPEMVGDSAVYTVTPPPVKTKG